MEVKTQTKPQFLEEMNWQEVSREDFIEDQSRCCLCGGELRFKHQFDYTVLRVREDADCPSCGVKMKTSDHTLQ